MRPTCDDAVGGVEDVDVGSERAGAVAARAEHAAEDGRPSPAEPLDEGPGENAWRAEKGATT